MHRSPWQWKLLVPSWLACVRQSRSLRSTLRALCQNNVQEIQIGVGEQTGQAAQQSRLVRGMPDFQG